MDSKERDNRIKDGMSERGEILFERDSGRKKYKNKGKSKSAMFSRAYDPEVSVYNKTGLSGSENLQMESKYDLKNEERKMTEKENKYDPGDKGGKGNPRDINDRTDQNKKDKEQEDEKNRREEK